jgi:hypothetical protein
MRRRRVIRNRPFLQIYAVYDRNKKLLAVMGGIFLVSTLSGVLIPTLELPASEHVLP